MQDLADEIKKAPHAGKAKQLFTYKMKELITAKVTQVPEFEQDLFESAECVLAEATPDKFWVSGLLVRLRVKLTQA